MIAYLVVGLVFLLLIVLAVLARKHWHWSNIVFVLLTYLAGVAALSGLGKVYERRTAALRDFQQSEVARETALTERDLAIYGPPGAFQYTPDSLRGTNERLNLELIGQGRVWMNGSVEARGENYLFKFKTARDANDPTLGKMKNVLLYVFADASSLEQPLPYPATYLGTFRVSDESLESLELAPQFVVSADALTRPATWSLFEKMPIDRWNVFHTVNGVDDLADLKKIHELRTKMVAEIIPPEQFKLAADSKEYEAIVDRLLFDGMAIGDIEKYIAEHQAERKSMRFEPAPQEVFVRYRFDEKSNRSYVVDGDGRLDLNGEFSSTGQAYNKQIHYGREITFNKGDEILIDQLTADGYQRADQTQVQPFSQMEPVTEIGRIYRRRLVDFPFLLAEYRSQANALAKRTAETKLENEVTQRALDDTLAQERNRDDSIARLQQDRDNLRADNELISNLLMQRSAELDEIRQRMAALRTDMERMLDKVGRASPPRRGEHVAVER